MNPHYLGLQTTQLPRPCCTNLSPISQPLCELPAHPDFNSPHSISITLLLSRARGRDSPKPGKNDFRGRAFTCCQRHTRRHISRSIITSPCKISPHAGRIIIHPLDQHFPRPQLFKFIEETRAHIIAYISGFRCSTRKNHNDGTASVGRECNQLIAGCYDDRGDFAFSIG